MRGGDTYYLNKPISMSEHSYLNLTILPPYPWYQPIFYTLDSMVGALGPIFTIIGIFTGIATLIGSNIWQRKKIMFLKKCINITKKRVNRGSNNKQQKSEDKESNKT